MLTIETWKRAARKYTYCHSTFFIIKQLYKTVCSCQHSTRKRRPETDQVALPTSFCSISVVRQSSAPNDYTHIHSVIHTHLSSPAWACTIKIRRVQGCHLTLPLGWRARAGTCGHITGCRPISELNRMI